MTEDEKILAKDGKAPQRSLSRENSSYSFNPLINVKQMSNPLITP
jgi:hypothetical protein